MSARDERLRRQLSTAYAMLPIPQIIDFMRESMLPILHFEGQDDRKGPCACFITTDPEVMRDLSTWVREQQNRGTGKWAGDLEESLPEEDQHE